MTFVVFVLSMIPKGAWAKPIPVPSHAAHRFARPSVDDRSAVTADTCRGTHLAGPSSMRLPFSGSNGAGSVRSRVSTAAGSRLYTPQWHPLVLS